MAHRWHSYLASARTAGARTASEIWEARTSFNPWPLAIAPAGVLNSWLSEIGSLRTAPDEVEREIRDTFLEGFHEYAARKYESDVMPEAPSGSFYRVELYNLVKGGMAVGNGWMVRRVSPSVSPSKLGPSHLVVVKFETDERGARELAARLNRLSAGSKSLPSGSKHEAGKNPMIYTIRNANKKVVAKIVEGKPGEKIRVTSYDDLGRAYTHNEKSLFDAAAHVGGRGATVSGGWEDLEPSSRLLLQRWSAAKHESGRNPLTLGERAKMRLGVLSPAAARSANSREKDLFRSHTGEIQRLAESVEACRRCEHGAEKRALKQLALARKTLEGLTKLAKYRSDPDVAEASLKAFRRQIAAAEGVLTGKKPAAIVKRDPKAGRGRHSKFGEYEEAQVHESENNPRVSRTHPRRREVAVFKAHSSSRATAVAAKLRKAGHDSAVIGGYGGRTVVIDTPTRGTKGGSLSAADAALRAKIRVLVGKK